MKRQLSTRILSLILSFVMLVSCFPVAHAAEVEETLPVSAVTEPVETEIPDESEAEQTDASEEVTEAPEETVQETTESAAETEETEATEPSAETVPEETAPVETVPEETAPVETVPEETVPEETVPEETLPEETVPQETEESSFVPSGMPEDYVLSEEQLAEKQTQIELGVLDSLEALIPGKDYVEGEVLAIVDAEEDAAVAAAAFNGEVIEYFDGFVLIRLLECTVPEAVAASLDLTLNLPVVSQNYIYHEEPVELDLSAEFNYIVPEKQSWETWVLEGLLDDPYLQNPSASNYQYFHDVIDSYAAWGVTTGDKWVKVGLIDSGVNTSHEDLRHVINRNISGSGDAVGHGTQMAGIITATMNNGVGGVGIAPGVTVYSYGIGSNPTSALRIKAINKAITDNVHVVNMSIGSALYDSSEQAAITRAVNKGITIVASAGNDGTNTIRYPGALDGVICVAATDRTNGRVFYSNYGSWVDISAPGDRIVSPHYEGGYAIGGGTSQAAAVVTGVVALYTSAMGQRVAPATVEKVMKKTATKVSGSGMGAGIVNIGNMLGGKPAAPTYKLSDASGNQYKSGATVPCESKLYLTPVMDGDDTGYIIYTINGKAPSIKNGFVVNGDVYESYIDLSPYAGTTVTVKAAFISGMGLMGKSISVKAKVALSTKISSITINGSANLKAGKSCTYTATVNPVATANQKVTWSIVSASPAGIAKIDAKSGKLTTKAGKTGEIVIRATSAANSSKKQDMRVNIINNSLVSKITLNYSGTKSYFVGDSGKLSVASMVDKSGFSVYPRPNVRWTSSNKKVLTIDSNGTFQALSKGKATITCLSLDGSGKTAKVTIEVKEPVADIVVTGSVVSIAPGSTATLKATVYPSKANNKKVTWHLYNAPSGVSINTSTGKVSVSSYVKEGSLFYVYAQGKDYPNAADNVRSGMYPVYVYKKCTGVYIQMENYNKANTKIPTVAFNKNNTVKTVNLFSVDLPNTTAVEDTIDLYPTYSGTAKGNIVELVSSKPDVVSVDGFTLTAHKAGTATITLKALDGSGKKATCTVKVTNPVSSLSIRTGTTLMSDDTPYLVYGKSVKNTAAFTDTYGTPSNKKVKWSFKVVTYDTNGENGKNLTETLKNAKLVTLSGSGTLTVKKGAQKYSKGEMKIWVYAESTDGTNQKAEQIYYVIPPTTKLYTNGNYLPLKLSSHKNSTLSVYFYSDQHNLYYNKSNNGFTATSSNPKVAGVAEILPTSTRGKYELVFFTYNKTGSTKITIKANDGSGKSCSFTVKMS